MKQGLRTAIVPMVEPTATTRLRGVAWVYLFDTDSTRLGLIVEKRMELREAPTVKPSFQVYRLVIFASSYLRGLTNVRKIFKNKGRTLWGVLYNAFAEDMVMVTALPKQFPRQAFQVTLCRFRAFGLQFAFQAEDATLLLFPPSLSQKVSIGRDSRAIKTQVNAYHVISGSNIRGRNTHNHMQRKPSFAIEQVGTARLVAGVLDKMSRDIEGNFHAPVNGCETTRGEVPLDPVRTHVVADRACLTLRSFDGLKDRYLPSLFEGLCNFFRVFLFLLALPGECAFHGLCRLDASRTHQLSRKRGVLQPKRIVRVFVQLNAVAAQARKAVFSNRIETRRVLVKRLSEQIRLFLCRVQL